MVHREELGPPGIHVAESVLFDWLLPQVVELATGTAEPTSHWGSAFVTSSFSNWPLRATRAMRTATTCRQPALLVGVAVVKLSIVPSPSVSRP